MRGENGDVEAHWGFQTEPGLSYGHKMTAGIEPAFEDLQSPAWPLGYVIANG